MPNENWVEVDANGNPINKQPQTQSRGGGFDIFGAITKTANKAETPIDNSKWVEVDENGNPISQTPQPNQTFLGVPKEQLQQYYNQQVQKQQAQQPLQVQPQIGVNPTAQQPVKAISTKLYPTLQTPPEEPSPYKTIEQEQFESQQFQQKILNPNQFIIDESGQLEQPKQYVVAKPKKVLGLPTEEQANKFVEQRNLPKIKEVAKDYQDTDPQKSSFMWEQAINIEPNNYENYLNYSYNQAQLGNAQQALDNANTAEAILKSTPLTQQQKYERTIGVESPSVYQIQSWAKNKLGDYEASIDAGKKSLQILSQKPTGKYAHQQNEKDYENASYTYGVMANSAAKIADENGANKYNEQSKKMLDVANGIRVAKENEAYRQWFASGQFEKDFLYSFVQPEIDAIMGVGSGVKSMVETAGKVMQSKGDLKGNVLKTVNTAISTVFSSFMAANPVVNYGFAAIGTMGEGYAPEIYQSLMAPVSAFIKDKSDLSETQKELVNTADVIGMLLVFKMGHNVIKGVGEGNSIKAEKQAIQDAELIKKVVGMQKLTEAELKKVEQSIEEAPDTEVNKAAKMALKVAEKKKEIQTETDTKIAVAQKKGFYEKDVKTQISDEVFTTIDKLEKGEPITNEFIDKASTELYNEYKRLEKIKDADTRTNTIEQINEVQERIGRDIELLENTKLKQKETGKFAAEKEIEPVKEPEKVEPPVETKPVEKAVEPVAETPKTENVAPVEEMVLYRGTSKNSKNSGKYLSDSYDYAKSFANTKSGKDGMGDVQEIKLKKGTKIFESGDDTGLSGMVDKIKSEIPDLTSAEIDKIKNREYNEVLENRGYDGISYTEGDSQSNKVSTTVELFNPDKSIESKTVKSTAVFSEPTSKSVLKQYTDNQEQLYKDHVEKTLQDKGIEIGNDKELVTQEVLNEMSKNPDKPISENVEKGVDNYVEQFGEKPTTDALLGKKETTKPTVAETPTVEAPKKPTRKEKLQQKQEKINKLDEEISDLWGMLGNVKKAVGEGKNEYKTDLDVIMALVKKYVERFGLTIEQAIDRIRKEAPDEYKKVIDENKGEILSKKEDVPKDIKDEVEKILPDVLPKEEKSGEFEASLKRIEADKALEKLSGMDLLMEMNSRLQSTDVMSIFEKAKKDVADNKVVPETVADEIIKTKKGTVEDEAALLVEMGRLKTEENVILDKLKTTPEGSERNALLRQQSVNRDKQFKNYEASAIIGREASNIFNLRQAYLNKENSLYFLEKEYMAGRGITEMTPEQKKYVQDTYDKMKAAENAVKEVQDKFLRSEREKNAMQNIIDDLKRNKPKQPKYEQPAKRGRDLMAEGFDELSEALGVKKSAVGGKKPDIPQALAKIGRGLIDEGIASANNVMVKIREYVEEKFAGKFDFDKHAAGVEKILKKWDKIETADGKIKIPKSLIRGFVEGGTRDIETLTEQVRNALKDEYPDADTRQIRDAITEYGRTVSTSQEEINVAIRKMNRIGRLMSGIEDAQNKKRPLRSGLQRDKIDAKEREMQRELNDLLKDLPLEDVDLARHQKSALDAKKTRLNNQIEDLQREIDTKEKQYKKKAELIDDAETKELVKQRDELKKQVEKIREESGLNEKEWNDRIIKSAKKRKAELEDKLKRGDFSKKERKQYNISPELEKAQADLASIKLQWDLARAKDNYKNLSGLEKAVDKIIKFRTAIGLLTGIKSFAKIVWYSMLDLTYKEPVDIFLTGLSKIIPNKLAERSMTEGHINWAARAQKYRTWAQRKTWKDAVSYLTSGKTTHPLYKRASLTPEFSISGGKLHGMEKYPLWKGEFDKWCQIIAKKYEAEGLDPNEPKVRTMIEAMAGDKANHLILMGKNVLTSGLKSLQASFYRGGGFGKILFYTSKALFPIMSVPTNYTIRSLRGIGGTFEFLIRLAVHGYGKKEMTPQQIDNAIYAFKEGMGGSALMALVLGTNLITINDDKQLVVGGWKMPQFLSHHPTLQILKIISEAKQEAEKSGSGFKGFAKGLQSELKEIPYLSDRALEFMDSPEKLSTFTQNFLLTLAEPQLIKDIASMTDKERLNTWTFFMENAIKRRTENKDAYFKQLLDRAKLGLPGLRQTIKSNEEKELLEIERKQNETPEQAEKRLSADKLKQLDELGFDTSGLENKTNKELNAILKDISDKKYEEKVQIAKDKYGIILKEKTSKRGTGRSSKVSGGFNKIGNTKHKNLNKNITKKLR